MNRDGLEVFSRVLESKKNTIAKNESLEHIFKSKTYLLSDVAGKHKSWQG